MFRYLSLKLPEVLGNVFWESIAITSAKEIIVVRLLEGSRKLFWDKIKLYPLSKSNYEQGPGDKQKLQNLSQHLDDYLNI